MNNFMGKPEKIHVTLEMGDHLLGTLLFAYPEKIESIVAILVENDVETSIDTKVEGDDFRMCQTTS